MESENTAPTDTSSVSTSDQPVTAPAAAAAPAPAFTQDDVNRIVAKRLEEDRARRVAPRPEQADKKAAITADEVTALLASQRAFDRVTASAGLSDRQLERMEAARRADNPQDVSAWARGYLEDMGLGKSNVNTPSLNAQTAPLAEHKPSAVAPSSSQPSAVTPVTTGGLVDIYNLTPEQFASMTPAQMREHHEANMASAQARTGAPRLPRGVQKR